MKIDNGHPKVSNLLMKKVSDHFGVVLWDGEDRS